MIRPTCPIFARVNVLCFVALWAFSSAVLAGQWQAAAPMQVTREYPGLAVMPDGKVLAVSGHPLSGKSLASAELYDPQKNAWTPTGSLSVPRNGVQPGGLIALAGGKYLLAGGGTANRSVHEAELYDYTTGKWTITGEMHVPRCVHSATQFAPGKVLVAGGIDWLTGQVHASAELYDEVSGTWTETGAMAIPRFNHGAVRLDDGRVLVVGGNFDSDEGRVLNSAEIYEPRTGRWRETAPMLVARRSLAAIGLSDGRVLVVGGMARMAKSNKQLSAVEVFDPRTEKWTAVAPLHEARWGPTATLLSNGQVLATGGAFAPIGARSSAELFDPQRGTWSNAGKLKQARNGHRAIMLKNGRVLIAGGHYVGRYLSSCEIYAP